MVHLLQHRLPTHVPVPLDPDYFFSLTPRPISWDFPDGIPENEHLTEVSQEELAREQYPEQEE